MASVSKQHRGFNRVGPAFPTPCYALIPAQRVGAMQGDTGKAVTGSQPLGYPNCPVEQGSASTVRRVGCGAGACFPLSLLRGSLFSTSSVSPAPSGGGAAKAGQGVHTHLFACFALAPWRQRMQNTPSLPCWTKCWGAWRFCSASPCCSALFSLFSLARSRMTFVRALWSATSATPSAINLSLTNQAVRSFVS